MLSIVNVSVDRPAFIISIFSYLTKGIILSPIWSASIKLISIFFSLGLRRF